MDNILKQFGDVSTSKDYEFGTIIEVKHPDIYIIETSNGLHLTIQDTGSDYILGDLVVLGLFDGSTNNAFILKKGSKSYPLSVNFIVDNGLH